MLIQMPAKIEAVYNPDVIKPMKKVIIHSKKQLPLMKLKISAETIAFGNEFNLDSLQFFESSVYGIQAENIEIPEDNQFFCSVDGVVFSKDKKTSCRNLIRYLIRKIKKGNMRFRKEQRQSGGMLLKKATFRQSRLPILLRISSLMPFIHAVTLKALNLGQEFLTLAFLEAAEYLLHATALKK